MQRMSSRNRALGAVMLAAMAAASMSCRKTYEPGLGELMSLTQMRHVKLWFAGQAQNWRLAEYELDELQEGFDDVVRFHPTHKDSPLPLSALVPKIMNQPLGDMRAAVMAHDTSSFVTAYDAVTAGCNSCHQATNFGFNTVRRPTSASWFGNQEFSPRDGSAR